MSTHFSHPDILDRLKRGDYLINDLVTMRDDGRGCLPIPQQRRAAERAVGNACNTLANDYIDHCLAPAGREARYRAPDRVRELSRFRQQAGYAPSHAHPRPF